MKTGVVITLFFLALAVEAQSIQDSLILTESQNDRWFLTLKEKVKSEQLSLIRNRILLDTNVYIRQSYPDRIRIDAEKDRGVRKDGFCKPVLIFNHQGVYISNRTKSKSVLELSRLLTDDKIINVSAMKDGNTTAIYGTRGACGVILFATRNKKIFKQIESIDFGDGF